MVYDMMKKDHSIKKKLKTPPHSVMFPTTFGMYSFLQSLQSILYDIWLQLLATHTSIVIKVNIYFQMPAVL